MQINRDTVEEFWGGPILEKFIRQGIPDYISPLPIFQKFLNVSHNRIYDFASGRASLEWLLCNLRTNKTQVLVPAFTCPVVEKAITNTGFICNPYDFSENIGTYDWSTILESSNDVAAIIVTHFFGSPVDFNALLHICRRKHIAVIEDCAHCLGGTINSSVVGSIGDASIFSFNYDKPISLGWGGIACINNLDYFSKFIFHSRSRPSFSEEAELMLLFSDWLKIRRNTIRLMDSKRMRIYHSFRNKLFRSSKYAPPLSTLLGPLRSHLLAWCLDNYSFYLNARNTNSDRIAGSIPLQTWPISCSAKPAWLKLKVNCNSVQGLKKASKLLLSNGIRAGNFNWPTLSTASSSRLHPLSALAASQWIDIPVHQELTESNIELIINILSSLRD